MIIQECSNLKSKYDRHHVSLKDVCQGLTTFLLITVVSAVVLAIADGPQRHAAVVGPAGKLSVVVTSIIRTHCGKTPRLLLLSLLFSRQKRTHFLQFHSPNSLSKASLHPGQQLKYKKVSLHFFYLKGPILCKIYLNNVFQQLYLSLACQ